MKKANTFNRIRAISRKEFLHIIHDPRTLLIVFLMPIVQLIMFGYALNMEIQKVELAVIDHSRTPLSREIIRHFSGSRFFDPYLFKGTESDIDRIFKERKARAVLILPADLDRNLRRGSSAVQVIVDGSDGNAATLIRNYCNQVLQNFNEQSGFRLAMPFSPRSTILFNPDMKSAYFFVPGLVALLLVMISALLTSITITREKESGTLEQILVSPVRPREIIIGKVSPYILLAFLDGALVLLVGIGLFDVPFRGSLLLLLLLTTLYITTALSLGLLISTVAKTQQVAMMMALTATLLPTILLSGFIFPIASMPVLLQYLSYIIPARFYLLIVRGIMLKGSHFTHLWVPAAFLAGMTLLFLANAVRKFSTNLES
ncbi:MAG: ABC transporter permease [Calditrichia bacterium]